jgi:DNA repair exonuclease SbcCD ATPase subunit
MIKIQNLTAKNFLSIGNATQGVNFDRRDLTLVLGENLDLGGDGSRNGVGKTSLLNALCFAIYGQGVSNIKKDNLVNKTNDKNMLVSLQFEVNGVDYRIERGRKPNVLRFFVSDKEQASQDTAQGENKETQANIEKIIGISHDMFKHIVALNTYSEPFLSLRANEQRSIIEQLLGITQLSERAEKIKELNRLTKNDIRDEEVRISAVRKANEKIEEQISSLQKRRKLWLAKQKEDVEKLTTAIDDLAHVDITLEIQAHRKLDEYNTKKAKIAETKRYISEISTNQAKLTKIEDKLKKELAALDKHECYACGQSLHDEKQDEIRKAKQELLQETGLQWLANNTQQIEHETTLGDLGEVGPQPKVFYDKLESAYNHKSTLETLERELQTRSTEVDPYHEQIDDMKNQALQEVSYDTLNDLSRIQDHQDFLLKLLTSKDSFVRKKIIEQNLSYLNSRLTFYLDRIGLPHTVVFQNDLSVSIEELGRELDFGNLSRGERNRLILSMNWAFRDVFESLYHPINLLFIDEMIDSGMDTQGVEASLSLLKQMSRERGKSIWLVSHRDELAGRVENILKVTKENGFTTFDSDVEIL